MSDVISRKKCTTLTCKIVVISRNEKMARFFDKIFAPTTLSNRRRPLETYFSLATAKGKQSQRTKRTKKFAKYRSS